MGVVLNTTVENVYELDYWFDALFVMSCLHICIYHDLYFNLVYKLSEIWYKFKTPREIFISNSRYKS